MKVETGARRQIVIVLAVTVITLLAVAVGALLVRPTDPRAYPEHDGSSLSASLHWANLQLPVCAEESVRYAKYSDMFGVKMWLRISASRGCIDEFLKLNSFDGSWTKSKGAFVVFAPKGFGWPDSDENIYTVVSPDFDHTSPLLVELAGDFEKDAPDLFVRVGNV
ncbi:hypothetical protein OHA72_16120 [Dactylosporangium sp. NBC_01737]|uniref:hypothetical protein n=1 Tax=Dactylosporangium sp. NBC_01737 TaxID=2975959 RepID=UPI002E15860E|nr:hypothetical protein OHA72_16120 [Dactylosporangium sp. NBC_01737]